jgi:hypothetical protein
MINELIMWMVAHPLEFVGLMACGGALFGLLLIPRIRDVCDHGHPRI